MAADLGDLVAPLIGARQGEVVFQPNVTLAHAVIFSAFDSQRNRTKIVTDAMHFPSILYLIDEQRRLGAEVAVIPSDDGISVDTERLIEAIDEKTAIVNLSHVLFKSAFIHDVAAIAAKAREVGAITVIDGYQAVGTIPVDVAQLGIDIYIGGCLKWLCGGPGNAFVWVDPDVTPSPRAEAHRLDGPSTAVYICARTGPPRRCLAIASTARPISRVCTPRGPAWRSSMKSASRRSAPNRCGKRPGCWSWPTRQATAARPRATRRGEPERSRLTSTTVTKSPMPEVSRHPLRLPARRGHPALTALLQSRRRARRRRRGDRAKSGQPARGGRLRPHRRR